MSAAAIDELTDVLDRVKNWSVINRIALVKGILETFIPDSPTMPTTPRGRPVEEILGDFKTDKPAPDDDTVRQRIDEYRMEKHG